MKREKKEKRINYSIPQIDYGKTFIPERGTHLYITLTGETYPEDAQKVYAPMFEWLKHHLQTEPEEVPLYLTFALHFVSTSSQKELHDLTELVHLHYLRSNRKVQAVYKVHEDDEDLFDMIEELFVEWDKTTFTIERFR